MEEEIVTIVRIPANSLAADVQGKHNLKEGVADVRIEDGHIVLTFGRPAVKPAATPPPAANGAAAGAVPNWQKPLAWNGPSKKV